MLDWIRYGSKSIALFIEPVGYGDLLDDDRLTAHKKSYYDTLFKKKDMKIISEGRFVWNNTEHEFEHYTTTDSKRVPIYFNRTCYWIVS